MIFFVLASVAGQVWRLGLHRESGAWIVRQFSLDDELNLPTAYQAISIGGCAILLGLIALREHRLRHRGALQWGILAAIFLLLACDEAFRIHERLGQFRDHLPVGLGRTFRTGWIIFALFFVTIVGLSYLRFLSRLPGRTAILFIVAAGIYICGAMGMEIVVDPWVEAHGRANLPYQFMATLEETLEMTGIAIFLYALTWYLAPFETRLLKVEHDLIRIPAQTAAIDPHAAVPPNPHSPL